MLLDIVAATATVELPLDELSIAEAEGMTSAHVEDAGHLALRDDVRPISRHGPALVDLAESGYRIARAKERRLRMSTKAPSEATLVKLLFHRRGDRGMELSEWPSRCVQPAASARLRARPRICPLLVLRSTSNPATSATSLPADDSL